MADRASTGGAGAPSDPVELFKEVALTGVAVLVPAAITAYVLFFVWGLLMGVVGPIADTLPFDFGLMQQAIAAVLVVLLVLVVGFVAHFRRGKRVLDYFDATVERVPGLGTVYQSFRRMSDVVFESDADHFQGVKLVQFPSSETYSLAFETADTTETIETAAEEDDMVTLFVPMAPNPFMGGFVLFVPEERVIDVDLTVEQGIRATVTSGVVVDEEIENELGDDAWELSDFDGVGPDVERLRALGIDVEEFRRLDVEELRSLDREDVEDRLLAARDRLRGPEDDEPERGGST